MSENQVTLQELEGRSQKLTFSRRQFLQQTAWHFPLTTAPRRQPVVKLPEKYPAPLFQIGDRVADTWVDEFDREQRELGEVVGICWHPKNRRWEYLINWTAGASDEIIYPCFDGHLVASIPGAELKLL
jgi:hypothetical protein